MSRRITGAAARATDTGGLFVEDTFHVQVNAVNDAPFQGAGFYGFSGPQTVDFLAHRCFGDIDTPSLNLYVTGISGSLQYSSDGGSSWNTLSLGNTLQSTWLVRAGTSGSYFLAEAYDGQYYTSGSAQYQGF